MSVKIIFCLLVLAGTGCFAMMQEEKIPFAVSQAKQSRCCSLFAELCEIFQFCNPQQIAPNSPRMHEIMIRGNNDGFRIKLIPQAKK